jgi:uncharacterized repeat protein (TIGR01451 family)
MRNACTVLTVAVSMTLLTCEVAVADTVNTTFEPAPSEPSFALGPVGGQNGWLSSGPFDQAVVATANFAGAPSDFGEQSLRHSNAVTSGSFGDQTFAAPTQVAAGEALADTEYLAEFSFISTTPTERQAGLFLSISPVLAGTDRRMSHMSLEDAPGGIEVVFWDVNADGQFVAHPLGTLTREVRHTIMYWIKFNPGPANDVVRVFIDGVEAGESFTTWEDYYRSLEQEPSPINSLLFRAAGTAAPDLRGEGYLFDNITVATGDLPDPEDGDDGDDGANGDDGEPEIDIEKRTRTRFASPGDLITYRVTVTNRDDVAVRSLRSCDEVPRALGFVRATVRLQRAAGRRLCSTIRLLRAGQSRTFRATFRLRANAAGETVVNRASADAPTESAPSPSPPDAGPTSTRRSRVARDAAAVTVGERQPIAFTGRHLSARWR